MSSEMIETEFMLGDTDIVFGSETDPPEQTIDVEVEDVGTVETEVSVEGIQLGLEELHAEAVTQEIVIEDDAMTLMPPPPPVEPSPEDELRSHEKLDRSSPDLWPQNLPAAAHHLLAKNQQKPLRNENLGIWAQGLDPEDINLLHQFGSLTSSSLVEEVKKLQNIAYQLGLEEAKEMTRGKLLHVLDDSSTGYTKPDKETHVQRLWQ